MTINTTCPTKHNPNLTCALGRIIKQTDEGPECASGMDRRREMEQQEIDRSCRAKDDRTRQIVERIRGTPALFS